MKFDMRQCKPGDKVICRDGRVVIYNNGFGCEPYPHRVTADCDSNYWTVTHKGTFWISGGEHKCDIVGLVVKHQDNSCKETPLDLSDKPASDEISPTRKAIGDKLSRITWRVILDEPGFVTAKINDETVRLSYDELDELYTSVGAVPALTLIR